MGVLPVLSLLYTVFAVTMATEAMTDGDSAETNVQLSSDEAAVGVQAAFTQRRTRCQSGWSLHQNRCFRLFNLPRTWSQAEAYCVAHRGHLASVHNIAEAVFVGALSGNRLWTWIGGGGGMLGHTWYWTDGTPVDYTNFHAWEPNNNGGNEHCIHTNFNGGGVWNDIYCSAALPFVCVK